MSKLRKIIESFKIKEEYEVKMSGNKNKIDEFKLLIYIIIIIIFLYIVLYK